MPAFELSDRYEYLREIGRGGTGRVILVHDRHLELDVALKILEATRPKDDDLERFRAEFEILSRIEHPGIARAYDFGFAGERPFFSR
jgi:serine/threonine-protein kinase